MSLIRKRLWASLWACLFAFNSLIAISPAQAQDAGMEAAEASQAATAAATAVEAAAAAATEVLQQNMATPAVATQHLDFSSVAPTFQASQVASFQQASIMLGDITRTVMPTDMLTAAEMVALQQVLSGGAQSLILNQSGAAVAGSFNLNSVLQNQISNLVIPSNVTAIQNFATHPEVSILGNLTNSGTIYGVSTNPAVTMASFSANNILNQTGGLLSTVLPQGGLLGYDGALSQLNLSLSAINNIINQGMISSSGSLTATAGGSIYNVASSVNATSAVMQAMNAVNLNAANITNAGLIASVANNINVATQTMNSLSVLNAMGTMQAMNGAINVGNALSTAKVDTHLLGGDWISQELNVYSGNGKAILNVEKLTGVVGINAGQAHVLARTEALQLGQINLSGDPTFFNQAGDILLTNSMNLFTIGAPLAIIASGDILTSGAGQVSLGTSSFTTSAAQLVMAAGVDFTTCSGCPAVPPYDPAFNGTITIDNGTGTGGKIDLTQGGGLSGIFNHSQAGAGGQVYIIAYRGTNADSGTIKLPTTSEIDTSGVTGNGGIVIQAGASSGTSIQLGDIKTNTFGDNVGSPVYVLTVQPNLNSPFTIQNPNQVNEVIPSLDLDNLPSSGYQQASITMRDVSLGVSAFRAYAGGDVAMRSVNAATSGGQTIRAGVNGSGVAGVNPGNITVTGVNIAVNLPSATLQAGSGSSKIIFTSQLFDTSINGDINMTAPGGIEITNLTENNQTTLTGIQNYTGSLTITTNKLTVPAATVITASGQIIVQEAGNDGLEINGSNEGKIVANAGGTDELLFRAEGSKVITWSATNFDLDAFVTLQGQYINNTGTIYANNTIGALNILGTPGDFLRISGTGNMFSNQFTEIAADDGQTLYFAGNQTFNQDLTICCSILEVREGGVINVQGNKVSINGPGSTDLLINSGAGGGQIISTSTDLQAIFFNPDPAHGFIWTAGSDLQLNGNTTIGTININFTLPGAAINVTAPAGSLIIDAGPNDLTFSGFAPTLISTGSIVLTAGAGQKITIPSDFVFNGNTVITTIGAGSQVILAPGANITVNDSTGSGDGMLSIYTRQFVMNPTSSILASGSNGSLAIASDSALDVSGVVGGITALGGVSYFSGAGVLNADLAALNNGGGALTVGAKGPGALLSVISSFQVAGRNLTLLSEGDILLIAPGLVIDTSGGATGGGVIMVTGTTIQGNGPTFALGNPTAAGGSILGPLSLIELNTQATGPDGVGGSVFLLAIGNGGTGGQVLLPASVTITTGGNGSGGANGDVTVTAGAGTGTPIAIGGINTVGADSCSCSGLITLATGNAGLNGVTLLNGVTAGVAIAVPGDGVTPVFAGSVTAGDLTAGGGSGVAVFAGSDVSVGSVTANGNAGAEDGGIIYLIAGSDATDLLSSNPGTMTINGAVQADAVDDGLGGLVTILFNSGATFSPGAISANSPLGQAGTITIADTAGLIMDNANGISANGVLAGAINFNYSNGVANNVTVSGSGNIVGPVSTDSSTTGNVTISTTFNDAVLSIDGIFGNDVAITSNTGANSSVNVNEFGTLFATGFVDITAQNVSGGSSSNITTTGATQSITISTSMLSLADNAVVTANGITITTASGDLTLSAGVGSMLAAAAGISIEVSAGSTLTILGTPTFAAGTVVLADNLIIGGIIDIGANPLSFYATGLGDLSVGGTGSIIGTGTVAFLDYNPGAALQMTGDLTIDGPIFQMLATVWNNSGTINFSSLCGACFTADAAFVNQNGTINAAGSDVIITSSGTPTVTYAGTGTLTADSLELGLTVNDNVVVNGPITVVGVLGIIGNIGVTITGAIDASEGINISTTNFTNSGSLNTISAFGIAICDCTGNLNILASGSYNSTGGGPITIDGNNITFAAGTIQNISGQTFISADTTLTVGAGSQINVTGGDGRLLVLGGPGTNLDISGGGTLMSSGLEVVAGAGGGTTEQVIFSGNQNFAGSPTIGATGAAGGVTVNAGSNVTATGGIAIRAVNFTNNGTVTPTPSVVNIPIADPDGSTAGLSILTVNFINSGTVAVSPAPVPPVPPSPPTPEESRPVLLNLFDSMFNSASQTNQQNMAIGTRIATDNTPGDFDEDVRSAQMQRGGIQMFGDSDMLDGSTFFAAAFSDQEVNSLIQNGVQIGQGTGGNFFNLDVGNVLFAPMSNVTVGTHEGNVAIGPGCVAFVIETGNDVAVYNLHDGRHGGVKVYAGNKQIVLEPGQQLVLSRKTNPDFDKVNPAGKISYRRTQEIQLEDGITAYVGDFSIWSAFSSIKPLRQMVHSTNVRDKRLANQIIKNAVILADVTSFAGPYKSKTSTH